MVTVGVLALQGGFAEHLGLLRRAADHLSIDQGQRPIINLTEVRTPEQLATCDALILPGGESTTLSLVAAQSGLLEPLREFVNATKRGGQELIGGLDVKVHRNHFGRQLQSFVQDVDLPFLRQEETEKQAPFPAVFIRAPVVDQMLPQTDAPQRAIEVLARFPSNGEEDNIVALRQGNVFGTSFHPELTDDVRIHVWWLGQVITTLREG